MVELNIQDFFKNPAQHPVWLSVITVSSIVAGLVTFKSNICQLLPITPLLCTQCSQIEAELIPLKETKTKWETPTILSINNQNKTLNNWFNPIQQDKDALWVHFASYPDNFKLLSRLKELVENKTGFKKSTVTFVIGNGGHL